MSLTLRNFIEIICDEVAYEKKYDGIQEGRWLESGGNGYSYYDGVSVSDIINKFAKEHKVDLDVIIKED
jgi:hypothetical protein